MVKAGQVLEVVARKTSAWLKDSKHLGIRFGEETLTDLVLLELKQAHCPDIVILQTSKANEPSQGTDWEWWVGTTKLGWFRFAIQAKKLGPITGRYDQLAHRVGGRLQIDLLEDYARSRNAIPMYCLFNSLTDAEASTAWQCCQYPVETGQLGCSLVPTRTIRRAIRKRGGRTFFAIHSDSESLPWRCIQCPTKGVSTRLQQIHEHLRSANKPETVAPWDGARIHIELPESIRDAVDRGGFADGNYSDGLVGNSKAPRYVAVINLEPGESN